MEDQQIEWRPVVGYEGLYEVSNTGLMRRPYDWPGNVLTKPGTILNQSLDSKRYRIVGLMKDGKRTTTKVHKHVCAAFIGPRPLGMQVNHIDCDKNNNHISNLEYVTGQENIRHAYRNGLMRVAKGCEAASKPKKLTKDDVIHIRKQVEAGVPRAALAKLYGVHVMTIGEIVRKEIWRWVG